MLEKVLTFRPCSCILFAITDENLIYERLEIYMEVRLQKYLADAGVASRRKAEELIAQGKVKVNGEVVKEMGWVIIFLKTFM